MNPITTFDGSHERAMGKPIMHGAVQEDGEFADETADDMDSAFVQPEHLTSQRPRPFAAYKSSGMSWLGEIPTHWRVSQVRRFFGVELGKMLDRSAQNGTGIAKPYVRAANVHWNRIELDSVGVNEMEFSPEQLGRYRLEPSDLLVTEGGVTVGRSAMWKGELEECYYQNSLNRARALSNGPLIVGFLYYWMYFTTANGYVDLAAEKATFGHLTNEKLKAFPIVVPEQIEQQAIVAFLDRETARIDALIAKKRQLIEHLQEQRIALLSQAVTKGLDSSVPMSDSGIPWLRTIPAHWDMPRLKFLSKVQTGLTLGHDYGRRETVSKPYLRVANVQDGFLDLTTITTVQIPREEVPRYELQKDDVLMTEGGDFDKLGRGYVWDGQIESCLHQNHIFAVRCNPNTLDPYFLDILTTSLHGKNYFTRVSRQTTNLATINQTTLGDFPVPLPPIEEQKAILAHIRELTGRLDALIIGVKAGIVQLHEYRAALISAAVTGKIDVRGAVA